MAGQLERFDSHVKYNLQNATPQDVENFIQRLKDFDSRLTYLFTHLKAKEKSFKGKDLVEQETDEGLNQLKSLNSALNRKAVLHRIEKEFDIKIESKQQFDWSEKIKNPGESKKIGSKTFSQSEGALPIQKLSSFNVRIDEPVREEDRESEASSDTSDDHKPVFKPPTPQHKVSTITRNDKTFKAAIASIDDDIEH